MSTQAETHDLPSPSNNKRPAEDDIDSVRSKKINSSDHDGDIFARLEKLKYRTYRILKFHSGFWKCLLKNMRTLQEIQTSEHRGERHCGAYRFHKHKLEPYLLGKCVEETSFKSNQDMDECIKSLESSHKIKRFQNRARMTLYQSLDKKTFSILYKRAIHSEYYDEDMQGGQAEYQSDSCGDWRYSDDDSDDESQEESE
jgi:hypothetical protein